MLPRRAWRWWVAVAAAVLLFPMAAWAQAPPTLEERFQQGVAAFRAERYQKSLELFQRLHKERPTQALVNFYLGVSLKALKRPEEALPFLTEALARDPKLKETHYHLGVAYYNAKKFDEALAAFRAAEKSFPEQSVLYYYEGLILLELGRPQEALEPLRKAQELDAAFRARAAFLRGVAHYRLGQAKEAQAAFREVQTLEPDSPLAASAAQNLQALEEATKPPKRFSFTISSGFQYDDNVILEPNSFSFLSDGTPTGPPVNRRIADGRGTASFRAEYRHPLAESLELGVSYATYGAFHGNLPHFNLNSHNPGAYLGLQLAPFYLRAEYDYQFSLLGNDSSLGTHSVGPNLFISVAPKLVTQLQFRFQDKTFFENRFRDSDAYVITGNQYFYILGPGGYVRVGYQYEEEEARRGAYDSDAGGLTGGLYLPLPWGVSFATNASWENREYDHDFFGLGVRDEDLVTANATLTKALWDGLGVSLSYTLLSNDANIGDFDYDQNIYGVNLTYEH